MIIFRAFRKVEIETELGVLSPAQEIVFATALFLILERGNRISRDDLSALLWPKAERSVRAHRLRQTLFQLRKLGLDTRSAAGCVALSDSHIEDNTDTIVSKLLSDGPVAFNLYWLPGYNPTLSVEYCQWLDEKREKIHKNASRALLPAFRQARASADWCKVEMIARLGLRLDPYNETWVLGLSEALALQGEKKSATAILERYTMDVGGPESIIAIPAQILRRRIDLHSQSAANGTAFDKLFVGRSREMTTLTTCLDNALRSRGGACLLVGEAGVGKSRISSELGRIAELKGVSVQHVGCKPTDLRQPLSAFVKLIPRLRDLPGALGCAASSLDWLRRVTDFESASTSALAELGDPAVLHTSVRRAVFDLFDAVCDEQCLLLVVEDIQWLDSASETLLASIVDWSKGKRLLCLFNSRNGENSLTTHLQQNALSRVVVKSLATEDSERLAVAILQDLGQSRADADLEWLIETADGNPFFLQELTKHRLETGKNREIPSSIMSVLNERISRLTSPARRILETSSVLGENATIDRIELVLEYPAFELIEGVQELAHAGMLKETVGGELIAPRHDLVAAAATADVAPLTLKLLHRRCGLVLETRLSGNSISTSLLRACAMHWHHAGDSSRAYGLALKCATHLSEIGLTNDASAVLEAALTYCSTNEMRAALLRQIADVQLASRQWNRVLSTIERVRILQGSPDDVRHDDLELMQFEAFRQQAAPIQDLFRTMVGCVHASGAPAQHRVQVAGMALKMATSFPDLDAIERIYQDVAPLLLDNTVDYRSRLIVQMVHATMCGDLHEAVSLAHLRVNEERKHNVPFKIAQSLSDLAFVLTRAGPLEAAIAAASEAYEIATTAKQPALARECATRMLGLLVDTGSSETAEWLERASKTFDRQDASTAYAVLNHMCRIALRENRIADARKHAEASLELRWLSERKGWLAASLAVQLRVAIAEKRPVGELRDPVEKLQDLYGYIANIGGQDNEIAALCAALAYVGEKSLAKDLLTDYDTRRRDLTPWSADLLEISSALKDVDVPSARETPLLAEAMSG